MLLAAACVAAIGEVALPLVARELLHRYTFLNPDALWLVPLLDAPLFAALGLGTVLVVRRFGLERGWRAAFFVLAFLAVFEPLLVLKDRIHPLALTVLATGVALTITRFLMANLDRARRWTRVSALALLAACAMGAIGWNAGLRWTESRRLSALPPAPPDAPNVILVVLDAVRASALNLYGNPRPNTPFMNGLAREGVTFERAYATSSWTLPSHASLFTGRYPTELDADWTTPLGPEPPTLAEHFASRGYATGGFSANLRYVSRVFGLTRGFAHFDDFAKTGSEAVRSNSMTVMAVAALRKLGGTVEPGRKQASRINDEAVAWALRQQTPFFMFLNYFDGHRPYDPPAPFDTLFSGKPRRYRGDYTLAELPDTALALHELLAGYDAAVAYQDAQLASLFQRLEARGFLRNAIVIVTSDHGDLFGEHGLMGHGDNLYALLLHVPLLWYAPGRLPAGARIVTPVSLRDLAKSITSLAGDTSAAFPGVSLFGASSSAPGGVGPVSPILSSLSEFSGTTLGPLRRGDMASLIHGPWHYILNGDGVEELYDLRRDTLGATNLAAQTLFADTLHFLRERLRALPLSRVSRRHLEGR